MNVPFMCVFFYLSPFIVRVSLAGAYGTVQPSEHVVRAVIAKVGSLADFVFYDFFSARVES